MWRKNVNSHKKRVITPKQSEKGLQYNEGKVLGAECALGTLFFSHDTFLGFRVKKAFLELHLSIILASFTGIFGKLITLSAGLLVFWRIIIAGAALWLFLWATKKIQPTLGKDKIGMILVGVLLAIQWTFFYASIKTGNVSVAVVAFSTIGFFTAFLEPIMNRRAIQVRELLLSGLSIVGVMCIFGFNAHMRLGITFGLLSAFAAALLAIFFKYYRAKYQPTTIMGWQLIGGFLFCCAVYPIYAHLMPAESFWPGFPNLYYLPVFAIFSTLFNLEPVYTIIMAFILFHEGKDFGAPFYIGIGLIGLSVLLQTLSTMDLRSRASRAKARALQKRESV